MEILKEWEEKSGKEIINYGGLLYMKRPDSPDFRELAKFGEVLNSK